MSNGNFIQIKNHGRVILCSILSYIWLNVVFRILIIYHLTSKTFYITLFHLLWQSDIWLHFPLVSSCSDYWGTWLCGLFQTRDHNWAVYVNPVGVDATVKVQNTRCVAGGFLWNPYYTQLADPLNVSHVFWI